MTLRELEDRMDAEEWVLQMEYDSIVREAREERAMDAQLSSDHRALVQRQRGR